MTPTRLLAERRRRERHPGYLSRSHQRGQGALLHHWIGVASRESGVPLRPLRIQVVGSFMVGLFMLSSRARIVIDAHWRLLVLVGFCRLLHHFLQLRIGKGDWNSIVS
jgi:hypothetical protein